MQVLLTRTKAASPGLPELLGSSERKVGSIRFCPHLCQLPVRVGGCHQPPETSPRVHGRGSGSPTGSAAGQCCGHTCGLVLFCGRSPAFSLVVTRVWRPLMGRLCQRVSDPGPHSRPRLLPPRRQCVASGAASSPAPCPVASGGPAASPALSSGSGRKAARGGDGGAGIMPHQARAGARPCRGRVKGRFAGYVPNLWGQQGASTVGPDGLLFPVGCELDPQALAGPVRGGRVCLGGGKGPCARGEEQLFSGTGRGPRSAVTKSHGAGVPATPVRTR